VTTYRTKHLARRVRHHLVMVGAACAFMLLLFVQASGDTRARGSRRTASDDYWHYSSVGNLGLTVTNFGVLGQGYNVEDQPSCWYKTRSSLPKEQVEHFSYAGIWIGGQKNGQSYVSTAIYDGVFGPEDGGWEFTSSAQQTIKDTPEFRLLTKNDRRFDFTHADDPVDPYITYAGVLDAPLESGEWNFGSTTWDSMVTRSSIVDASLSNPYAAYAKAYDPAAISHQDLITAFTDTNIIVPGTGVSIPNHVPLGVHVYLESYSWYDSFADAFVVLNYTITNIPEGHHIATEETTINYGSGVSRTFAAGDTIWTGNAIVNPYFGIWVDASVGNMNYTDAYSANGGPGGRWNWYDNMNTWAPGYKMGMQYDYDGDAGWSQSYLGVKVLGVEPLNGDTLSENWGAYYSQWVWQGGEYSGDFPMPQTEEERYNFMRTSLDAGRLPTDPSFQDSWMMLITTGPLPNLAPGESFNVAYAIVCGKWAGSGDDSAERRANIYLNAEWAQVAYNGEDRNGNGMLDEGEDVDGDGKITRYILPGAPDAPSLAVVPEEGSVTLYWNNAPESSIDPITNKIDFEGYRVYSSPKTTNDDITSEWTLLADYDIDYDLDTTDDDTTHIGFDVGFGAIQIDSLISRGILTADEAAEEIAYIEANYGFTPTYRWVNTGVKQGWPRSLYYAVTSYDRGDPDNNLESLESNPTANRTYAYPGTKPTQSGDKRVSVYPNPYRGRAAWDGLSEDERLIWFRYLPSRCEITIFNVAGEQIDKFKHNAATYQGDGVERLVSGATEGESIAFSGGEHAWDLLSADGQEIATGLYIYVVKDLDSGDKKTGRFLVIK